MRDKRLGLHLEHLDGLPLGQSFFGRSHSGGLDLQRIHSVDAAMTRCANLRPETWRFVRFRRRRRRALVMSLPRVSTKGANRAVDRDGRQYQEKGRRHQNVDHVEEPFQTPLAFGGQTVSEVLLAGSTERPLVTLRNKQRHHSNIRRVKDAVYFSTLSSGVVFDPFFLENAARDITNHGGQVPGTAIRLAGGSR